ncbi:hypothetical protein AMECASPLE_000323 [Ameca splendens]|uniref:Uncharacterized protein n=1 Tax=Ameca splendens TaxID=208324 RepID=A0ABV0ZIB2_9TELE
MLVRHYSVQPTNEQCVTVKTEGGDDSSFRLWTFVCQSRERRFGLLHLKVSGRIKRTDGEAAVDAVEQVWFNVGVLETEPNKPSVKVCCSIFIQACRYASHALKQF